tara:strand:+ start:9384 stop:10331 length:948 start_codon:yes stop_codon:yes gene_type:complete
MLPDERGFFLMWRSGIDENHPIMRRHSHYLKLWMWLLGKAAHRGNADEVTPEGCVRANWSKMARVISYEGSGGQWHDVSPTTAKNICEWFAGEGMVVIEKTTRGASAQVVLSICNWRKWQNLGQEAQRNPKIRDEREPCLRIVRDSDSDFTPDSNYDTHALMELWGPLKSRTPHWQVHEQKLATLHRSFPHWGYDDVAAIIANVIKHKEGKLNFIWERGPAYLAATLSSGQQVADYAHSFEPFGENHNGTHRANRVERGWAAFDEATGHTDAGGHPQRAIGGSIPAISGTDAPSLVRIQLGDDGQGRDELGTSSP